ncbi:MAG: Processive diacylglycerol beta-glucosyltransferase [Chlamydiales bacterium]|nr:Processive diacylglycerol beta-glucosyltransferase [Chlamydiales bacterium]
MSPTILHHPFTHHLWHVKSPTLDMLKKSSVFCLKSALTITIAAVALVALNSYHILPMGIYGAIAASNPVLAAGMALFAAAGVLYMIYHFKQRSENQYAENDYIQKMLGQPGRNSLFTVDDQPEIPGTTWLRPGLNRTLIISSELGGGHKTAAKAVEKALEKNFFSRTIYPTDEVPLSSWFNYFQKKGWNRALKFLLSLEPIATRTGAYITVEQKMKNAIWEHKPQLVVCVQPLANNTLAAYCKKYNIPCVVVPTDYYTEHFFHGIQTPPKQLYVALPFDEEREKTTLTNLGFKEDHIVVTGYPVRSAFQEEKKGEVDAQIASIRKEYKIDSQDKVIVVAGGAQGGKKIKHYLSEIKEHTFAEGINVHVFALCGNNESLKQKIDSQFASDTNFHTVGWIQEEVEMAAYTKLADTLITKPGGASTSEAWALGTYCLFDGDNAAATRWEPVNMQDAEKAGMGATIIPSQFHDQLNESLEARTQDADFPGRQFNQNFMHLAKNIIKISEIPS